MKKCEHIIGILYDFETTDIVTLQELKGSIEFEKRYVKPEYLHTIYTIADYCDKRKSTNLTQFQFCPFCGEKIDWKAIKEQQQ